MPLAVLESMGSGCTSILSDIPPHREIDPPNNVCYFVEPYDINSIIKIIREVSSIDNGETARGKGFKFPLVISTSIKAIELFIGVINIINIKVNIFNLFIILLAFL